MTVTVKGLNEVNNLIATLKAETPKALAKAQNNTLYKIWAGEKEEMKAGIDRPTPWSLRAVIYQKTTESGTPKARVWFADLFGHKAGLGAEDYLGVQILGGERTRLRRSEKHFISTGLMKRNETWVPQAGANIDAYGNVRGSQIAAIMNNANLKYIAVEVNGQTVIFSEVGGGWVPVLRFVPRPMYRPRYKFYERAEAEVKTHLLKYARYAVEEAIAASA